MGGPRPFPYTGDLLPGGEEALALAAAGIPFEVVPGVSSALAAPLLAGIPVTHRGIASAFTVLSGHSEEAWAPVVRAVALGSMTLFALMGLGARSRIARALLSRGWAPKTPAAILLGAGTSDASAWFGDLRGLAGAPVGKPSAPGTLCIGPVVELAGAIGGRRAAAAVAALP